MCSLNALSCSVSCRPWILRGLQTAKTSLPHLPCVISLRSCLCCVRSPQPCTRPSLLFRQPWRTLGIVHSALHHRWGALSSHRRSPCSSYLQIPVNHPHLVAVQDGLQDLLDAVAVGERRKLTQVPGEAEFFRHFYSAAFHPSAPLPIMLPISSPAAQLSIPLH